MRKNMSSEAPEAGLTRALIVQRCLGLGQSCLALGFFLLVFAGSAGARSIDIEVGTGVSEITRLDGSAREVDQQMQVVRSLVQGDSLRQGSRVRVADNSRIELRLPDDSYIRFDAGAVFELTALSADRSTGSRDIDVNLVMGNVWASVSKLFSRDEKFDITTQTSVAGIRGTKYRMNVHTDQSAMVRVYEGAIEVKSAVAAPAGFDRSGPASGSLAAEPVSGPQAVSGPHPVSMEEWVYIVRAMQQMVIHSDGTADEPASFSIEEDEDDWVRWNRRRDEAVGLPTETDKRSDDTADDTTQ